MSWRVLATAACVGTLCAPAPALAQRGSAMIFGAVVNRSTQGTIPNVEIVHNGDGRIVRSDSLGYYRFTNLKAGIVRFTIRAPGYPPATVAVALTNNERLERDIEIDSIAVAAPAPATGADSAASTTLPEVAVKGEASLGRRFHDFERRKMLGRGSFLTRSDIEQLGANSLMDALRGVRGVVTACGGGNGCFVRMARAPMRCLPEYVVDERVDNMFGPTVAIRDIEGIEVYTGPADVPGEFAGVNAGCGVIVIWTKSGPTRRKKA